jgi:hypothetical protein
VASLLGDTPGDDPPVYVYPRLVSRYEADGTLPAVPLRPVALPVPAEAELAVACLLADR